MKSIGLVTAWSPDRNVVARPAAPSARKRRGRAEKEEKEEKMSVAKSLTRRLLAGVAAAATLLTGLAFAGTANAVTYDPKDEWQENLQDTGDNAKHPKLTLTKYLTETSGSADNTGSVLDDPSGRPASGVEFTLQQVTPTATSGDPNTMNQAVRGSYNPVGAIYYGITDSNGVIENWYASADAAKAAKPSGNTDTSLNAVQLPVAHQYYLLHETEAPQGYKADSADSIFDLPYHAINTVNGEQKDGYVYNLHVYPKNVNDEEVSKILNDINGDTNDVVAKVGDTLHYTITKKIQGKTRGKNTSGGIYLDDSTATSGTVLRVADRLSSAFGEEKLNGQNPVRLVWDGGSMNLTSSDYTYTSVAAGSYLSGTPAKRNTKLDRIATGHTSDALFTSGSDALNNQAHFMVWDFFNNEVGSTKFASVPDDASNLHIEIDIAATVTNQGDILGHTEGELINDVASDEKNNTGNPDHHETPTASAGFQFGKTDTKGNAVPDAEFHLANPANADQWLATDGTFKDKNTDGATFVTAKSNADGVVTFVGLPLFTGNKTDGYKWLGTSSENPGVLKFNVVETKVPDDYKQPSVNSFPVSFASHAGQAITTADRDKAFGPDSGPDFGQYKLGAVDGEPTDKFVTNIDNVKISNLLKNYTKPEKEPIHLPLTGGQGIVLLLVLGAAIMAVVLIERKRRAAKARR